MGRDYHMVFQLCNKLPAFVLRWRGNVVVYIVYQLGGEVSDFSLAANKNSLKHSQLWCQVLFPEK